MTAPPSPAVAAGGARGDGGADGAGEALSAVAIGGSPKDQRMDHGCILRRPRRDPPRHPGDRRAAIP